MNGSKTQTSRIWKEYYCVGNSTEPCAGYLQVIGYGNFTGLWSVNSSKPHIVYAVGRKYSIQPGRGKRSVGRLEILRMNRRDVRTFDDNDVLREGFESKEEFMTVWESMHGTDYDALVIRFKRIA